MESDWLEVLMFITRTISGAVLCLVIFSAMIIGWPLWLVVTGLLSLIGLYELYKALNINNSFMAYAGYLFDILIYTALGLEFESMLIVIFIVYFIVIMAAYVIAWPKYEVKDIAKALFALFYAGLCMSYLYQIRVLENGLYYMWLVFIGAWGSDTCAYLIGILFGKHKIPSTLSPKKTVEGCVGGIAGAALIGLLYGLWADNNIGGKGYYLIIFALVGAVSSILSQIGDLAASAVKRNSDIKDYGKLIPGHGGVMDRFDSIIYIAPIIYYIMYFITIIEHQSLFS